MSMTLKAARVNKGLTQTKAAELIGVSRTTLISWEKFRSFPKISQLPNIELVYDVKYDDVNFLPDNYSLSVNNDITMLQEQSEP